MPRLKVVPITGWSAELGDLRFKSDMSARMFLSRRGTSSRQLGVEVVADGAGQFMLREILAPDPRVLGFDDWAGSVDILLEQRGEPPATETVLQQLFDRHQQPEQAVAAIQADRTVRVFDAYTAAGRGRPSVAGGAYLPIETRQELLNELKKPVIPVPDVVAQTKADQAAAPERDSKPSRLDYFVQVGRWVSLEEAKEFATFCAKWARVRDLPVSIVDGTTGRAVALVTAELDVRVTPVSGERR